MAEIDLQVQIYIVSGIAAGLFVVLIGIIIYLILEVGKLKKKLGDDFNDADSFDDDYVNQANAIYDPQAQSEQGPTYQNPYNPAETYNIKRAKLIKSLRNRIEQNPREDYSHAMSERNSVMDDEYPHPKHDTLKNGILAARSKMAKKAPIPTPQEWQHSRNIPPKDYPGSNPSLYNRPYVAKRPESGVYPVRPRGLSRQESDAMAQYDRTIDGLNQPPKPNNNFLHRNKY